MTERFYNQMNSDLNLLVGVDLIGIQIHYSVVKLIFGTISYTDIVINKDFQFRISNDDIKQFDAANTQGDPDFIFLRGKICKETSIDRAGMTLIFEDNSMIKVCFGQNDFEPVIYQSIATDENGHRINFLHATRYLVLVCSGSRYGGEAHHRAAVANSPSSPSPGPRQTALSCRPQ